MNGKLILLLSLFGLAMGLGTVFVIPSNVEPVCWLVIFVISAVAIAKGAPRRVFLHGLLLGLANCVWVTGAHVLFFDAYIAHHAREAEMMKSMPLPPRPMMLVVGPVVGVVSGIVIGLFAWIASLILKRGQRAAGT